MRPIDADALEAHFCENCYNDCESKGHKPLCACAYMLFIDDMPTLDIQSTIHSRWINEGDCHKCSNCGAILEEEFKLHYYQYCYHCGARMDD